MMCLIRLSRTMYQHLLKPSNSLPYMVLIGNFIHQPHLGGEGFFERLIQSTKIFFKKNSFEYKFDLAMWNSKLYYEQLITHDKEHGDEVLTRDHLFVARTSLFSLFILLTVF